MLLAHARITREARLAAAADSSAPARRARAIEALSGIDAAASPAVAELASVLVENEDRLPASTLACTAGWLSTAGAVEAKRGVAALPIADCVRAGLTVVFYDGRKAAGAKPVRLAEVRVADLGIETRWARVSDLVALAGDVIVLGAAEEDPDLAKAMSGKKVIAGFALR